MLLDMVGLSRAGGAGIAGAWCAVTGDTPHPGVRLHGPEVVWTSGWGCGYCAWETLDMLKSGTRRAGVAVREK